VGYDGKPEPEPEYNVRRDPGATRAMYEAGWDVLLAPLDTAGTIRLEGERYRRVVVSQKPEIRALLENYRIWAPRVDWTQVDPDVGSSVLFDTLAVALAVDNRWVDVDEVRLEVTDDGWTRRSEEGTRVRAALRWVDREAYYDWLVDRLLR
jgi:inosine-uridine nucleoside N-ribohydrolase